MTLKIKQTLGRKTYKSEERSNISILSFKYKISSWFINIIYINPDVERSELKILSLYNTSSF